jgi:hypothetical protein
MNAIKKLFVQLFGLAPRETGDILSDMNKHASELRLRATFDKEQIAENDLEKTRVREEAEKKAAELEVKNTAHNEPIAKAERVAARVEEFTA